jgi:hypothetical protein
MLPLSEYRYIRGAVSNPVIAREGMKHIRAGRDPKRMGIILRKKDGYNIENIDVVGFTLLLIYFITFQ